MPSFHKSKTRVQHGGLSHLRNKKHPRRRPITEQSSFISLVTPTGKPGASSHSRSPTGLADHIQTRLDVQALDRAVELYFSEGLASSTRKAYNSAKKRYAVFCRERRLTPLPVTEHQLCQFISHLANEKLCHSTIKCYLSAIRHLHIAEGYGDPGISHMARLEQVLKGIKSLQAKASKKTPRLPITPELLLKMKQVWRKRGNNWDNVMLWAASSLCFFGFLRSGEITVPSESAFDEGAHLTFNDITVDSTTNPQILRARIKASKTDPFRVGINIFVGRTNNSLCPVAAVLDYMTLRGPGKGPFFRFSDGKPLTRVRFVILPKEAITASGVDCSPYSWHSFRSGAATTAAKHGIGDAMIKILGRWKSSAYQLYINTPRYQLAGITGRLAATAPPPPHGSSSLRS